MDSGQIWTTGWAGQPYTVQYCQQQFMRMQQHGTQLAALAAQVPTASAGTGQQMHGHAGEQTAQRGAKSTEHERKLCMGVRLAEQGAAMRWSSTLRISSLLSRSPILEVIMVRNSSKSMVPLPSLSMSAIIFFTSSFFGSNPSALRDSAPFLSPQC